MPRIWDGLRAWLGGRPAAPPLPPPLPPVPPVPRVWLDVGAHLGEKTFAAAQADPGLRVYAFEPILSLAAQRMGLLPNFFVLPFAVAETDGVAEFQVNDFLAASSLLPMHGPGLDRWIGGHELQQTRSVQVPTLRLDTFLRLANVEQVEFLKIDAQGADDAVVRSLGARVADVGRITLEVQVTPVELYRGGGRKEEVVAYLEARGFVLTAAERQSHDQEENLTFVRAARGAAGVAA
jgi:FkbM family methyltransferase